MAIIYTYSNVTPEPTDLLVITDVDDNNYTKSSTITAAIAATIAAGQNVWFTTSGVGVITINSADFTLKGENDAAVLNKYDTILTKDDNGALTETMSSIRAIQTGDASGPNGAGLVLGDSTGRAFDMQNYNVDNTSVLEMYQYDGGSNVGYVPVGGTVDKFLKGDGTWADISSIVAGWIASDSAVTASVADGATFTFQSTGNGTTAGIVSTVVVGPAVKFDLRNNGGVPSNTTFYRGDGQWVTPAGGGSVTSVGTTNNIGGSSGISFAASPNPIVGAGAITLGYSGAIGDILYADTANTLAKLPIGATSGHVLTSNGAGSAPSWQAVAGGGTMSSWILSGDGGTPQTINDGDTVDIAGGTVITTAAGAADTVTINHNAVTRSDTTSTSSPSFGGTINIIDTITTSAEGHITAANVNTVTLPTPSYSSYTLGNTAVADPELQLTGTSASAVQILGTGSVTVTGAAGTITINGAAGSGDKLGFEPLSIYEATGEIGTEIDENPLTVIRQSVGETDCTIDRVKFFRTLGTERITIAVYEGTIASGAGSRVLLGGQSAGASSGDVNTISFTPSHTFAAGTNIIILISLQTGTVTQAKVAGATNLLLNNKIGLENTTYYAAPDIDFSNIIAEFAEETSRGAALHFYED